MSLQGRAGCPAEREGTCEGCGKPGATVELWYPGWEGSRPVKLHRSRACAVAARDRLGGRPYLSEQDGRLLQAVKVYVAELRGVGT